MPKVTTDVMGRLLHHLCPVQKRTRLIRKRGTLVTELVVAMGILAIAILPLSLGFLQDAKLSRAYYYKAIAMEILDGEMEVLMSGEWKAFSVGTHPYPVRAASVPNLPPGQFQLTLTPNVLRLEWLPVGRGSGSTLVREATLVSGVPAKSGDKK